MSNKNKKFVMSKNDPLFNQMIKEVAIERYNRKLDKKLSKEQMAIRRYTKAMTRYEPLWKLLKEAEFKEDEL